MSRTSCISEPANQPMIIIKKWQLDITNGDHCAAALLSFYQYWHDVKARNLSQTRKYNEVKERHGEIPQEDLGLLQYHTQEDLISGMLKLFSKNSIIQANKKLVKLGFISMHKNPSEKHRFDNTNYFLFNVENVQTAIFRLELPLFENKQSLSENKQPSFEMGQPLSEKGRTRTEITTEITTESNLRVARAASSLEEKIEKLISTFKQTEYFSSATGRNPSITEQVINTIAAKVVATYPKSINDELIGQLYKWLLTYVSTPSVQSKQPQIQFQVQEETEEVTTLLNRFMEITCKDPESELAAKIKKAILSQKDKQGFLEYLLNYRSKRDDFGEKKLKVNCYQFSWYEDFLAWQEENREYLEKVKNYVPKTEEDWGRQLLLSNEELEKTILLMQAYKA